MGFVHHKRSVSPPYLIFHMSIPPTCSSPLSLLESQHVSRVSGRWVFLPQQTAQPMHAPRIPHAFSAFSAFSAAWTALVTSLLPSEPHCMNLADLPVGVCSTLGYGFGEKKQHHAVNAWTLSAGEHETRSKEWISCLARKTGQIWLLGCAWVLLTCAFLQAVYLKILQKSNCIIQINAFLF